MAITRIDMHEQKRQLIGCDWRSLRSTENVFMERSRGQVIIIDMTIEQRNKLDGLEPWRYINIPTPDFSTPDWTAQQWLNLVAFVYNETDNSWTTERHGDVVLVSSWKGSNVFVACQGGQGRTGIALAILRAMLTEDFAAPVKAIRKFNPHFVETPAQEAYVKRIVKELDEMTRPVPAIEPIDWPVRAGKAEKRVTELESKAKQLELEITALKEERDSLLWTIDTVNGVLVNA